MNLVNYFQLLTKKTSDELKDEHIANRDRNKGKPKRPKSQDKPGKSQEFKDKVLALANKLGNLSEAARRLNVDPSTASRWKRELKANKKLNASY